MTAVLSILLQKMLTVTSKCVGVLFTFLLLLCYCYFSQGELQYFEIKTLQLPLGSKNGTLIQVCKLCIVLTASLAVTCSNSLLLVL